MAATTKKLTDNPSADIGVFSKLAPEIHNRIYACLFEDVLHPDPSDTPCPCRVYIGICEHTGLEAYKPLSLIRSFLALTATCKLFCSEAQALLFVDYVPKTAWVVRGEDGFAQMRQFLRSIKPEDHAKVSFAWRLDDIAVDSVRLEGRDAAEWLSLAIDRNDGSKIYKPRWDCRRRGKSFSGREREEYEAYLESVNQTPLPVSIGDYSTARFYYGHYHFRSTGTESLVVNGPLVRLFSKMWQQEDWKRESEERYERIVRM